ncbi:autotransporter domain-containing protein [Halomonas salipaludis]|uniref:Autotransporter n=1 Tax=Halomonas salipaludis TaxID=2032625 RepID=A0A2A2EUX7_9GAMM|nr:autotransporter domain-containing protein [Halomonas salipaludis]PAU76162.1 autotransporter [Halomonas salipaludis]
MNHIYNSIFNRSLGIWLAVAETARARGKGRRRARRPSATSGWHGYPTAASWTVMLSLLIPGESPLADPTVIPEEQEVIGSAGGSSSRNNGGTGGLALDVSGGSLVNEGTIAGGEGGASTHANGGRGGQGVRFDGGSLSNIGSIAGGRGGESVFGYGRDGGTALVFIGSDLYNDGTIHGGRGGESTHSNGGRGGEGVHFDGDSLFNMGSIAGGRGGESVHGNASDGGAGLSFSGTRFINQGTVAGADGGDSSFLNGGDGGMGAILTDDGVVFDNAGSISGGRAGRSLVGPSGISGLGGIGMVVEGRDVWVTHSGSIAGGQGRAGRADAMHLNGEDTTLELLSGFSFQGAVRAYGADATLLMNGDGDANIDIGRYHGFSHLEKDGSSYWTLTGGNSADALNVHAGALSISGPSAAANIGVFDVGGNAQGRLIVDAGGRLSAVGGRVGGGAGQGVLTVVGGGSVVDISGDLRVAGEGDGAKGSVILANGGELSVSGDLLMGPGSATGSARLAIGADSIEESEAVAPGLVSANAIRLEREGASVDFNHDSADYGFDAGLVSTSAGFGNLNHYAGTTTLTGDSAGFSGTTTVFGGTLRVGDAQGNGRLGGNVDIRSGATLGGSGRIGNTTIADGATLAPGNSMGTLVVDGDLALASGTLLDFELGSPGVTGDPGSGASDRVTVTGNLTLDGLLSLSQGEGAYDGSAGLGYYRLMTYGGTLTDNGLSIGNTPNIDNAGAFEIQAGSGNVDLFIAALGENTLQHWQGGDGIWNDSSTQWLNRDGETAVTWAGHHAVFRNAPGGFHGGTLSVEGIQAFQGLQFVDEAFLLAGDGQLVTGPDGSEIRVLADDAEISTEITGANGIVKREAGTLILSGQNSYAGGTTIAGGTVRVSDDGNLGSAQGNVTFKGGALATTSSFSSSRAVMFSGNGAFDVADTATLTLSGELAGDGNLTKTGQGTLHLSGANAYGNTFVNSGTLIGSAASISGDIANAGEVVLDQTHDAAFTGDIAGLAGNSGQMVKQGSGNLALDGDSSLDWTVTDGGLHSAAVRFGGDAHLAGASAGLTFSDEVDAHYAGVLSGDGTFLYDGTASVLLTGDSSSFDGTTTVAGGTLLVGDAEGNGSLGGALHIDEGATLGGSGSVGVTKVFGGGTIAPGNSIGTLTVEGDLLLDTGARYLAELSANDHDAVIVTGTATIEDAAIIQLTPADGWGANATFADGSTYTLFEAGTLVVNGVPELRNDFAFLDFHFDATASAFNLISRLSSAASNSFCLPGMSANACGAGDGTFSLGEGHDLYDRVLNMSAPQAEQALSQLSGELHASVHGALVSDSRLAREAANDRLQRAGGGHTTVMDNVAVQGGHTYWARSQGNWGRQGGDGNAASIKRELAGGFVGVDTEIGERARAGMMSGYTRSDIRAREGRGSASVDSFHLGAYAAGSLDHDGAELRGGVFYGYHEIDSSRQALGQSLEDERRAQTLHGYAELATRLAADPLMLEPFVNIAQIHHRAANGEERGGSAALSSSSERYDTTVATLGVRPEATFDMDDSSVSVYGSIGWQHALGDTTFEREQRFDGGDAFGVTGTPIARDSAVVSAGVQVTLSEHAALGVSYAGQYADGSEDHRAQVSMEWRF